MKKQVIMVMAFVLGSFASQAQNDSNARRAIEVQIEENTITFEADDEKLSQADLTAMIFFASREMTKMQTKQAQILAKIDQLEASGELSEEEADELRDKAEDNFEAGMEQFEEVMESWGEAHGSRMESWAEQFAEGIEAWSNQLERDLENDSTRANTPPPPPLPPLPNIGALENDSSETESVKKRIVISKDGLILKDQEEEAEEDETEFEFEDLFDDKKRKKSKKISRTESYFDIGLGFNQQLANGQNQIQDGPGELDLWRSTSFHLGSGWKSRIGNPYSKFYVKYGIDFSWHNFRLNGNEVLINNGNSAAFNLDTVSGILGFEKNKYHIAYFNVPVMFQLDFSDAGERDDAFTLGVGGYAGVRLLAKTETEYNTNQYRKVENKTYDDFYTEQFRYGLMAQIGFDSFKITASYDLNDFFRAGRGPAYNMVNLGFGWTL